MTISSDSSVPLVAVVGATGTQGGSVIRNLIASDKPYRLRALTRDVSKPAAQELSKLGVEVVVANIIVGNDAAVRNAFQGADIIFGVTNFWEHLNVEREIAEGKLIVDAAKAVGVKLLVFSGLPNIGKLSGGKYTHVVHFDGKAKVVEYARTQLQTVDVEAAFYMKDLIGPGPYAPIKQADGSYVWDQPAAGNLTLPYIDTARDYGLFVRYAIESPDYNGGGGTIYAYGEHIRIPEAASLVEKIRGVRVQVTTSTIDEQRERYEALGFPPHVVQDFIDMRYAVEAGVDIGYRPSEEQERVRNGLARNPATFEDFLTANPVLFAA